MTRCLPLALILLVLTGTALAQSTSNPFSSPIEANNGVVMMDVEEFADVPDADNLPARIMKLIDEAGTGRLFVNDMRGMLYSLSYDGSDVGLYLDMNAYGVNVEPGGRERGMQNFAFHPDFANENAAGYGRFYTYTDVSDTGPQADFSPGGGGDSHDTVLHEWVADDASAGTYDGGAPRELIRLEQPFGNHNAGHIDFNPLASPGDADYGRLYVAIADGGSGGDPMNLAQNLQSAFGKMFRIDPLGTNSANGEYGIPADNPFVGDDDVLDEIYAYGMRNPQRFGWDSANGNLILAEIGQNTIEEVSLVPRGGNLGWNVWEGSYRYEGRNGVSASNPRSGAGVTYPLVEWAHVDPLTTGRSAATGVHVFRDGIYPEMEGRVLVADFVSGEIFHFSADNLPDGGNDEMRRMLLRTPGGDTNTFLELIQAKNREQARTPAPRTDIRIDADRNGVVYLTNKHDGTIRRLVP